MADVTSAAVADKRQIDGQREQMRRTYPARSRGITSDAHNHPDSPCGQTVDEDQGEIRYTATTVAFDLASPASGHVAGWKRGRRTSARVPVHGLRKKRSDYKMNGLFLERKKCSLWSRPPHHREGEFLGATSHFGRLETDCVADAGRLMLPLDVCRQYFRIGDEGLSYM